MATSVKDLIARATAQANAPKKSGKPVFLFFKPGHKALIRPMFSLDDAITMESHNKYSDNPDYRVNAICAAEIGKPCVHCESAIATDDKKLKRSTTIFLPVYVHNVVDTATGQVVPYKEKQEDGSEVMKPTQRVVRVLELPLFGKSFVILQSFLSYERDEDDHNIMACDFSIEQQGVGTTKNFIVSPKAPKPFDERITKANPGIDKFHEAILQARTPLVAGGDATPARVAVTDASSDTISTDEDEIAVF